MRTPAPWQQTRDAFHGGKLLHGTGRDPRHDPLPNDALGWHTTPDEGFATYTAYRSPTQATRGREDVYATTSPTRPLRLATDREGVQALAATMRQHAEQLVAESGTRPASSRVALSPTHRATAFADAVHALTALAETPAPTDPEAQHQATAALHAALLQATRARHLIDADDRPDWRREDPTYLRTELLAHGYDALETVARDPLDPDDPDRPDNPFVAVMIHLTRPTFTSHRAEVAAAVVREDPVDAAVLADYPTQVHRVRLRDAERCTTEPDRRADPEFHRLWQRFQPPESLSLADYQASLFDWGAYLDAQHRASQRIAHIPGIKEEDAQLRNRRVPHLARMGTVGDFLTRPELREHFAPVLGVPITYHPWLDRDNEVVGRHVNIDPQPEFGYLTPVDWIMVGDRTGPDTVIHEMVHAMQRARGEPMGKLSGLHEAHEDEAYAAQAWWWTERHAAAVAAQAPSTGAPGLTDALTTTTAATHAHRPSPVPSPPLPRPPRRTPRRAPVG